MDAVALILLLIALLLQLNTSLKFIPIWVGIADWVVTGFMTACFIAFAIAVWQRHKK